MKWAIAAVFCGVVLRGWPVGRLVQRIRVAASIVAAIIVAAGLLTTTQPAGAQTGTTGATVATVVGELRELNSANVEIRRIAFAPTGGWVILYGRNGASWDGTQ